MCGSKAFYSRLSVASSFDPGFNIHFLNQSPRSMSKAKSLFASTNCAPRGPTRLGGEVSEVRAKSSVQDRYELVAWFHRGGKTTVSLPTITRWSFRRYFCMLTQSNVRLIATTGARHAVWLDHGKRGLVALYPNMWRVAWNHLKLVRISCDVFFDCFCKGPLISSSWR